MVTAPKLLFTRPALSVSSLVMFPLSGTLVAGQFCADKHDTLVDRSKTLVLGQFTGFVNV